MNKPVQEFENPLFRRYVDMIGKASRELDGPLWWSSYLSSKNRFYVLNEEILESMANQRKSPYSRSKGLSFLKTMTVFKLQTFKYLLAEFVRYSQARSAIREEVTRFFNENRERPIYFLKSFAYRTSFKEEFEDPFLKGLQQNLKLKGIAHLTLYHPFGCFREGLSSKYTKENAFPYQAFLKGSDFIGIIGDIIKGFFKGLSKSSFKIDQVPIGRYFFLESLSSSTVHSLLLARAYKNILNQINVEKYIYVYEGNWWERFPLRLVKKYQPHSIAIGYQHNVICPAGANYFPSPEERQVQPRPDRILTTGQFTADLLQQYGDYKGIDFKPCGAIRYTALMARESRRELFSEKSLLVPLEGMGQSACLVNYILKNLNSFKEWKIIIRCHPAMPYEEIKSFFVSDPLALTQFSLSSEKDLAADLEKVAAVLYWGSTVALEALYLGVPIICLQTEQPPLSPDPLVSFEGLKWSLRESESPDTVLNQIMSLNKVEWDKRFESTRQYLSNYLTPPAENALDLFSR